jgi:hypothetical protein
MNKTTKTTKPGKDIKLDYALIERLQVEAKQVIANRAAAIERTNAANRKHNGIR